MIMAMMSDNYNAPITASQNNATQESHGDWLAAEHNSAVANNLKQKYGKHICDGDNHNQNDFNHDSYDDNCRDEQLQAKIWRIQFLIMRMMAKIIIKLTTMMMIKLRIIMINAGVSGIPCLVVCKKDGTLVTKDGRAGVTSMVLSIIITYADEHDDR